MDTPEKRAAFDAFAQRVSQFVGQEFKRRAENEPDRDPMEVSAELCADMVLTVNTWAFLIGEQTGAIAHVDGRDAACLVTEAWREALGNEIRQRATNPN